MKFRKSLVLLVIFLGAAFFVENVINANAFSLMDDRIQIHGFFENQTAIHLADKKYPGVQVNGSAINLPDVAEKENKESGDLSRCRTTMQLELGVDLSDSVKFDAIGRGFVESAYSLQDDKFNPNPEDWDAAPDGEKMEADFDLREYHFRAYWDRFTLKVGRQQIVWGESDLLRLSDIINPLDMSWRINLEGWDNIRIPLRAIDAIYEVPGQHNFMIEGVAIPEDFRMFSFGAAGSTWDPAWRNVNPNTLAALNNPFVNLTNHEFVHMNWKAMAHQLDELQDDEFLDFQGGVRLKGMFGTWDLSAFYFYQRSQLPVQTLNMGEFNAAVAEWIGSPGFPAPSTSVHPDHWILDFHWPKISTVGFTFNVPENNYTKSVFRGEFAYTIDQPFSLLSLNPGFAAAGFPDLEYAEKDLFQCMIGFDRPTFIGFLNPRKTFFLSGQIFYRKIISADSSSGLSNPIGDRLMTGMGDENSGYNLNDDHEWILTAVASTEYYDGRILPQVAAVYNITGKCGLIMPSVEYQPTSNTSIILGGVWLFSDSPMASGIGAFEQNDEVFLHLKYTF